MGDQFIAESDDGEDVPMTVLEVTEEALPGRHQSPVGGRNPQVHVKVLEVRPATDAELREAERALAPEPELITIGRKPSDPGKAS